MLEEIRKRDESYGDKIPEHYQGPLDRRYLLNLVELLLKKLEMYDGR